MADTPYTPTHRSTTDLKVEGDYIYGAAACFGIDNHPNSQRIKASHWIADVEWNYAQAYGGKNNRQWLGLMGTVQRLEMLLNRA